MKAVSKKNRTLKWVVATAMVFILVGCGGKKTQDDIDSANADVSSGDSDSGQAMGLQTVTFAYDSYVLDSGAKSALDSNADILKDRSSLRIQIEGHCDERGGIQYNIALGEKRANIVEKYLIGKGISGDRIETISFGKERPIDPGHNEAAWAKNRRANFVITAK